MDNRTEQLADGVWRIELAFWVSAFVLANNGRDAADGLTVVDTGTRGMAPRLVRSIRLAGLDPRATQDVLLTHWHIDHAGGAQRFAGSSAEPRVWIGQDDLPVLTGARHPGETTQGGRVSRFAHRHLFQAPPALPDARALADQQSLPIADGVTVLHSPGHTPGHVALHLPSRGVLIAGDAVMNLWRLRPAPRLLCAQPGQMADTLARLSALDFDVLAPMHGPPITSGAQPRLAALAQRAQAARR